MSDFGSAFPLASGGAGVAGWEPGSNQLTLSAELLERGALRYTPAAVPVVECQLSHSSLQLEGGIERQVHLEIPAVALAEMAGQLQQISRAAGSKSPVSWRRCAGAAGHCGSI